MRPRILHTFLPAGALVLLSAIPLAGQSPPRFTSLALGEANTCGLTAEGAAYCWGDNSFGQVGDGSRSRRTTPTAVTGGLRFTQISIAGSVDEVRDRFGRAVEHLKGVHVCGITTEGSAYCWGADALGQIGAGRAERERPTPTRVAADARFTTLATNLGQSCAATAEGQAYCWGMPGFRIEEGKAVQFYSTPFQLPAALRIRTFLTDEFDICGVTADGMGICWRGTEQRGRFRFREIQLPDGRIQSLVPARVSVGAGYCGLDEKQRWLCWGQIETGLGVMTTVPREEVPGATFTMIRSAGALRCGLATTGAAHCSVAGARDTVALELAGETFASLTEAGEICRLRADGIRICQQSICGLRADGQGRCIRQQSNAQGSTGLHFEPVPGDLQWQKLYVGRSHSCGIAANQGTYCWGVNASGQLGDGSRSERKEPVEVRFR